MHVTPGTGCEKGEVVDCLSGVLVMARGSLGEYVARSVMKKKMYRFEKTNGYERQGALKAPEGLMGSSSG